MAVAGYYFIDLLGYWNLFRSPVPHFEKWSNLLAVFLTLATLAESIVTHSPDLAFAIKHDNVIDASINHFERR